MASGTYGINGYMADIKVEDGAVKYHFYDPEDVNNTADVSLTDKDLPQGPVISNETSEVAFSKVSKQLNDKRDARIAKQEIDSLNAQQNADAKQRAQEQEFLENAQHNTTPPVKVEKDGTNVYTGGPTPETSETKNK